MANIAYCKIFPSIGIARLGNSERRNDGDNDYFIGPEAPGYWQEPEGGYWDAEGRIKRQGARFRVYGFDEAGNVLEEITASTPGASIAWTVQVANLKAAGHQFLGVEAGRQNDQNENPEKLRNPTIADRTKLAITPTARTISGPNKSGPPYKFNDGFFFDQPVYLGELCTDEQGRLIVLGGQGKSGHTEDAQPISTRANNDGWYDDVSDGPVTVSLKINGADVPLHGAAWVIVAPPKFAPHLKNIITLYDVISEAAGIKPPDRPSFSRDIYPIFDRISSHHWVNSTALRGHGPPTAKTDDDPRKPGNFHDPYIIKQLANNSQERGDAEYRKKVFKRIRNPRLKCKEEANYYFMPLLSGDEGDATVGKPETWLYLLESQYAMLEQWANGNFDSDLTPDAPGPVKFDQIALPDQPTALTRAAVENCAGGPFYPGVEMTYTARYADWYEEPFRFKDGRFQPGEMTKRMAVPWQANFYESRNSWWPVQRPDDVLSFDTMKSALANASFKSEARGGHLANVLQDRIRWDRGLSHQQKSDPLLANSPGFSGAEGMLDRWNTLGFVVPRETGLKETLSVEAGRSRYDGLRDRDYFYYLLNIDAYPDFLPRARQLAEKFLQGATDLINSPGGLPDMYQYFDYTPEALAHRLDGIYAFLLAYAESEPDYEFWTKENIVERIRQLAPFNQLDGAWIRNVAHTGPIDRVSANIFNIWMDEMGNGVVEENHCNLYTRLMGTVGIQMDPIYTLAYANNPDMLESAYTLPMYQLAISEFTETYYPEILGMTLYLEWEVLGLRRTNKLMKYRNIDYHFYELHIGIDNAANGHGAKARQAVEWYLDQAQARGGDAEVQRLWRRIWTGYVAFATQSTVGDDLVNLLIGRSKKPTPDVKVADMMRRKKPYGSLNHNGVKLGQNLINDLFENPELFMQSLIDNNYIVPGSISGSRFFERISFKGPMYKVFTDEEIDIWKEWVVYLGQQACPEPPETDPAKLMIMCVEALRERQRGTMSHPVINLTGPDPNHPDQKITKTVAEWFDGGAVNFLRALSDPANNLIVKGNAKDSQFVTDILGRDNRMSQAFAGSGPRTGGKTWRQITTEWINKGCPLPLPAAQPEILFKAAPARLSHPTFSRLMLTTPPDEIEEARPRKRILGMGTVH